MHGSFEHELGPLAEAPGGGLWIGTRGGRLVRLDERQRRVEGHELGSPIGSLTAGGGGELWIGLKGEVARLDGGRIERWVWLASYAGGLGLLVGRRVRWVTREHGLPDNGVSRILADRGGRLWLLTNRGIAVAAAGELAEVAEAGPRRWASGRRESAEDGGGEGI